MKSENKDGFFSCLYKEREEYYGSFSILFVTLIFIVSIFYTLDFPKFKEANKILIAALEIGSPTFAFIIFTLDRFKKLEGISDKTRLLINSVTLSFFLITVPHLFVATANDISLSTNVLIGILVASLVLVLICFLYALSLTGKRSENIPIAIAAFLIVMATALIYSLKDLPNYNIKSNANIDKSRITSKIN